MEFETHVFQSKDERPEAMPSGAALPTIDYGVLTQRVVEYEAEHKLLAQETDTFVMLGEREKLRILQVSHNLMKDQTDHRALEILERSLPAHVALSRMLDAIVTEAVRSDKKMLRGVFRSFMKDIGQGDDQTFTNKISRMTDGLILDLNFSLRGQAGLIDTLVRKAEHLCIKQRAALCAVIVERMQQATSEGSHI